MAKTQIVFFNHSSSLWCSAQGAPAPHIVWKKNGIVVQNSTSVRYRLTITEENKDKYSCEVKRQDDFDKKEIVHIIECKLAAFLATITYISNSITVYLYIIYVCF